jgi:hypothetical protein
MFVVFDLDGTLANTDHRQHLVVAKDWRGFYAACDLDPPHGHIIETLVALVVSGHRVEIWSGRSDEVRDKTEAWLIAHGLGEVPLRMRKEHDYTPDDVLKRSWLNPDDMPDLIFDDRAKVVKMWREMGIPCCQVAEGDF